MCWARMRSILVGRLVGWIHSRVSHLRAHGNKAICPGIYIYILPGRQRSTTLRNSNSGDYKSLPEMAVSKFVHSV